MLTGERTVLCLDDRQTISPLTRMSDIFLNLILINRSANTYCLLNNRDPIYTSTYFEERGLKPVFEGEIIIFRTYRLFGLSGIQFDFIIVMSSFWFQISIYLFVSDLSIR